MYIRRKKKSEFLQKYTQPILEYKIDSWYESDVFPWLLLFDWFLIASSRHCNDVLLPWSWYRNCLKWKIASNAVDGTVGSRRSSFTDIFLNNVWKFPNNSTTVFYMLYWKVYNALLNLFLPKQNLQGDVLCWELAWRALGICGCGEGWREAEQQPVMPGSAGIQELWQSYPVIQVCWAAAIREVQVKHSLQGEGGFVLFPDPFYLKMEKWTQRACRGETSIKGK